MDTKKVGIVVCLSITLLVIILVAVLVPLSLRSVENDEYAVFWNGLSKSVDEEVKIEGRYVADPNTKVERFKRTLQSFDFSGRGLINCLSSEGLDMRLEVLVQFQIIKDKVLTIFFDYGNQNNYLDYLIGVSRSAIKDVCGLYTGENYFFNRTEIQTRMEEYLTEIFEASDNNSVMRFIQLKNVEHPPGYVQANQAKQETAQERNRRLAAREQALTTVNTRLEKAIQEASITLIEANYNAQAKIVQAEELRIAEIARWNSTATAFSRIKERMGVDGNTFVSTYLKYDIMKQQDNPIAIAA